jgi:membrane-bound lytic murein transglycosylase B
MVIVPTLRGRPLVLALCVASAVAMGARGQTPAAERPPFDEWLAALRTEALTRGISQTTVETALAGIEPLPVVIERDRTQAELTLTLDQYVGRRVTRRMSRTASEMARTHRQVLSKVTAEYGVPGSIIVAIWGLESNFGRFSGVRPTVTALATLAYDHRRAAFFRGELFHALTILDRGDIDLAGLRGSWAGAMGQAQFMPSSFLEYAVDFDGDGRRDIWRSLPDVFASIANYLKAKGWTKGERWGREVRLSSKARAEMARLPSRESGCRATRETVEPQPIQRWRALGVRQPNGGALPNATMEATVVPAGKRAFLVYRNYDALLAYNCAHAYALSVALLADRVGR